MAGFIAIVAALLAFLVPLAIPLFAQRWRTLSVIVMLAAAFFTWLYFDIERASLGDPARQETTSIGSFLGGLMLVGFAFGAIAKAVMLIGRTGPRS